MNRDLALGTSGAVIAGGYYWLAATIPDSALADAVGPQGLPIVYAVVLLLLSLILVARSLRTANLEPRTQALGSRIPAPGFHLPRVLGMLAIGVVYIAVVPWLGYVVSLAGLLFAVTWYLGGVISRTIAIVAVSGAIVFWLLFVRLLGIAHPTGVWGQLF
ncbi:MAG: tripartite tricarboxylate transporter TctB family protein [Acidobacteria bacterium]|nr:tripartite tricarboxylate transporter TctB family protein [Acidobacteriota bacterium]